MKLRTLAAAAIAVSLSAGGAMANNYTRAGQQTGDFAAGSPAFYNPFSGSHSARWWRVVFIYALSHLQSAANSPGAGLPGGGASTGGGKGAPGPVAGAGLPFLAVAGAAYLIRRRRSQAA